MKKYILFRYVLVTIFAAFSFGGNAQKVQQSTIHIMDFKVVKNENRINVNWSTDNATPTNYFELQKSFDGRNFKTVAFILGPDPSKKGCDCYGCYDNITVDKKEFFYRLKHVSTNGEVEFSETKMLASSNKL